MVPGRHQLCIDRASAIHSAYSRFRGEHHSVLTFRALYPLSRIEGVQVVKPKQFVPVQRRLTLKVSDQDDVAETPTRHPVPKTHPRIFTGRCGLAKRNLRCYFEPVRKAFHIDRVLDGPRAAPVVSGFEPEHLIVDVLCALDDDGMSVAAYGFIDKLSVD